MPSANVSTTRNCREKILETRLIMRACRSSIEYRHRDDET
jgi:hypothetical protein